MNRLAHRTLALAAVPALLLAGCSAPAGSPTSTTPGASTAASTVSITHKQGTAEVKKNPAKVVVLDNATLDTLDALDLEGRVAATAQATLPSTLDEYKDTPRVGTAQEPDLEAIARINPDAIIISGRSSAKYAELNQIAPTLDLSTVNTDPIGSLRTSAGAVGDLFDVRPKVDEKLAEVDSKVEEAKKAIKPDTNALILLTSGGKVSAFGPGGRFGSLIHDVLGVPAAATNLEQSQHGQAVSFEFIAETNPQTMFVVDRDVAVGQQGAPAKQVLDNPLVARTAAWTNDKVFYLDGADWYVVGYGLDSTERMIETVKDALD